MSSARELARRGVGGASAVAALFAALSGCGDREGSGSAADWPQWRGPAVSAVSTDAPLPVSWDGSSANVRWKAEVPGTGNSSPIVSRGRVYLTTAHPVDPANPEGEHWRAVLAWDADTGEELWRAEVFAAPAEKRHWLNTLAGPTPLADGERVYAFFGSALVALDREGEVVWRREVAPGYAEESRYGAASSPVLAGDAVVVARDKEYAETEHPGWIAAFDRATGEQLWRTEWEHTCCSYSTPLVVERGGGREILFAHSGEIVSYDADTGERLWGHIYPMLQMVSTPVVDGDYLAILGGADRRRGNLALRLSGVGPKTTTEVLWESERMAPQASSPVLYQGLLYNLTTQGVLIAYRPETGEVVWQERLPRGRNHASLVAGDGKVYATSSSGVVSVVAAGPEFELLASNSVGEKGTTASPALGAGCFLQRTETHLWCIQAGPARVAAAGAGPPEDP